MFGNKQFERGLISGRVLPKAGSYLPDNTVDSINDQATAIGNDDKLQLCIHTLSGEAIEVLATTSGRIGLRTSSGGRSLVGLNEYT